jgi:hypothetical protein
MLLRPISQKRLFVKGFADDSGRRRARMEVTEEGKGGEDRRNARHLPALGSL